MISVTQYSDGNLFSDIMVTFLTIPALSLWLKVKCYREKKNYRGRRFVLKRLNIYMIVINVWLIPYDKLMKYDSLCMTHHIKERFIIQTYFFACLNFKNAFLYFFSRWENIRKSILRKSRKVNKSPKRWLIITTISNDESSFERPNKTCPII